MSSFYLLLPAGLTPFLGIYIDVFGQRIAFREYCCLMVMLAVAYWVVACSVPFRSHFPHIYAASQVFP